MKFTLALLFAALLPPAVLAQQPLVPQPPALAARAWLLYDLVSNQVLVNENGNEHFETASLTKLMTAYLTFAAIRQNKLVLAQAVIPAAEVLPASDEGSRMLLEPGKPVTVEDLLHGLIVQSGNDAARVLAVAVGGSEEGFAAMMNLEAQRLGMKDTHFANATGLPHPQHYSSAHDLALLAAAIVRDFPERYPIYSLREYQYNGIKQINRNRLLWVDPYVDGMKTGYSETAGFCLVASAKRDNRRLVSVLLGAASDNQRATESQKLLNYGFRHFEAVRLYQKNQPVTSLPLWKGTRNRVELGFRNDLFLSVPSGMLARVLKLALAGKPYAEFPLVALETVPLANIFSRGWDSIRLFFQQGIF
ncbi:MAG: D-alanyl-D-alanine carboxypeptidase (penicillin-binding protein 5/6) [Gallionellaceae bacterium]|nr:MAG: D-alanyl-D-alanine carboxypeptidase (penicillin-binding protein 5/6) [Gallionellaceae bacterium]